MPAPSRTFHPTATNAATTIATRRHDQPLPPTTWLTHTSSNGSTGRT